MNNDIQDLNSHQEKIKSDLLIDDKLAVIAVLRDVLASKSMVSVMFHPGNHFLLTMLLDLNEGNNTLVLDYSTNPDVNKQLLASDFKVFIAKMHGVVIEFFFDDLQTIIFEGRTAFQLNIPKKILQLEHRGSHRVKTPLISPATCFIKDANGLDVGVNLVDISLSGMCITLTPSSNIRLDLEQLFKSCNLILPGIGNVGLTIAIARAWDGPARKGIKSSLVGCAFVGVGRDDESKIVRYINKLGFHSTKLE